MKAMYRLKKNEDFAFTVKKGTAKRNSSFVVHKVENELSHARVGISVSSKLGCAVTRNRIKRQMRAMIGELIDFESIQFDILVVAKSDFLNKTYQENKELLAQLLSQR